VSRAPAIFDRPKLDALAARHMARLPADRLVDLAADHLRKAGYLHAGFAAGAREWIGRLALLYAERLPKMSNLPGDAAVLFDFAPEKSRRAWPCPPPHAPRPCTAASQGPSKTRPAPPCPA